MNIQERIEALETEFAEKIKALKAEVQREDEFPQDGDFYWFIDAPTEVSRFVWLGNDFDNELLSVGNVYRTKDQADFAVEKLKVEAELRKFSRPFKQQSSNYSIVLLTWTNRLSIDAGGRIQHQGTTYFESEEKARQAIQSVGEDHIKKYLFRVED